MTFVQKIPHIRRFTLFLSIFLLAYLSGFFFRSESTDVGQVLGEKTIAKQNKPVLLVRTVQVHEEKVAYKKAEKVVTSEKTDTKPVAKQIGEHTWTISVQSDTRTGSAEEILQALNAYRQRLGKNTLAWDENLATFAQSRANAFSSAGTTDSHAGFTDLINNQDGFHKLGFMALGENSSFGYQVEAVRLIEQVYAGDAPHNDNQLNASWSHVGIGVAGVATDLIFAGRKM